MQGAALDRNAGSGAASAAGTALVKSTDIAPAPLEPAPPMRFAQLAAILVLAAAGLGFVDWRSGVEAHLAMETLAAGLAFVLGILAFARYETRRSRLFLFLTTGFMGTAVLEGYHAFLSSSYVLAETADTPESLMAWSWFTGRLLLAVLMVFSSLGWSDRPAGPLMNIRDRDVFAAVVALTAFLVVLVVAMPLDRIYTQPGVIPRPLELVPAILFLLAFALYFREAPWRNSMLAHWIMVSLVLSATSQVYMAAAGEIHGPLFDTAHLLKILGYFTFLAGFVADFSNLYRRSEQAAGALKQANEALTLEIASRRDTEVALRQREAQLADAQALAHLGSWEWDIGADRVTWSDELFRIYGHEPGEIDVDYATFIAHVHPADVPDVQGAIESVIDTGEAVSFDHRIVLPSGEERILQAWANVAYGEEGRPTHLWGTGQDVTDRRLAAEALRASEERFRAVSETAQDAIVTVDGDAKITYWNPAAARMFGYSVDEAEGADVSLLLTESIPTDDVGAPVVAGEMVCRRKDGSVFPVEFTIATWHDSEAPRYTAIVRDITERKRSEVELQSYAARLQASNRELEVFASIASHDLQEPLRKVVAFGDRLASRLGASADDVALDYLDRMRGSATRMQRLISDLLNLSRVATGMEPFEVLDLNDAVADALDTLEVRIDQTGAIVEVGELPQVFADPAQMELLFQNLVGNALKFRKDEVPPRIRIEDRSDSGNGTVSLAVLDNGIGFDEKYLPKLFAPFRRLHGRADYPGTGMGLAICRRIVERHGGTITAESAPGEGSTFLVTLPSLSTTTLKNTPDRGSPREAI